MRALVTGATGCVGRHLCLGLRNAGWAVTGTGRNATVGSWLGERGIDFATADLRDKAALAGLAEGRDVIYHCAALSSAWGSRQRFAETNIDGTRNLLEAVRNTGNARFVFVSSTSVYFDFRDQFDITERQRLPVKPVNAYAWSKREAERIVQADSDVDWVIVRPRGIIGAYDSSLVPRLVKVAKRGILPLPGAGKALVDVTCAENLVDALIAAGDRSRPIGRQIYNVSNGTPVRVRDLLGLALDALGFSPALYSPPRAPAIWLARGIEAMARLRPSRAEPLVTAYSLGLLAYSQTLDITKARRDLDYRPAISLEDGINQVSQWWRDGTPS